MEKYVLTNDNIAMMCENVEQSLMSLRVERREALRIKLTLEEVLLEYQAEFGEAAVISVRCVKRISTIRVELVVEGKSFDPFSKTGEEDEVIRSLLAGIGLAPVWSFKRGRNHIVFTTKKKPLSDTMKILLAIVLATIAGFVLTFLPDPISTGINDYLLTPISDAFMGLISAIVGPLIFLSVLGSICSMGNMETFDKIGSKTIKTILCYMLIIGFFAVVFGCLVYKVKLGNGGSVNFSQVLDMVYGIIPTNLFEPFVTGNALQLIFIAVMVGIAMLTLSSRVSGVFGLIEQISVIVQTIMSGLSSMMPVLIFVLFTGMIYGGNQDTLLSSWKLLLMSIFMMTAFFVVNLLRVAFQRKVSPVLLFKKVCPTFMIALTTASSAAAFATNTKDANKKLGIHKQLVEFGIPLGQVLFMPDLLFSLFCIEMTLVRACDIPITLSWLVISFLTNLLVAFAIPPIPGGMLMGLSIAFTQLGIPMEMMGIALAVSTITDFTGSAVNVASWQLCLIDVADSLDMLDNDVLHSHEL